jgi:uncharacterized protein YecA (UPF0149 family)
MFFEHADKRLRQIAANWMKEQGMAVKEPAAPLQNSDHTVGRNDPCPCGSGFKFKKCCGQIG